MACLYLYRDKLKHNFKFLKKKFSDHQIEWSVVTKLLCGNTLFLKEVLNLVPLQVCDSRISNLKEVKTLSPKTTTIYIKPPAQNIIKSIVRYADISLNTELSTLKIISREAIKQKKIHKVIIMIELGDLREGVLGNDLISFYSKSFQLKGIDIIGIGTNLNCLFGVMPSHDKLIQLVLYHQLLQLKFSKKLKYISGGTTVTLPLLLKNKPIFPKEINHFRVGEALFFGADLFKESVIKGMYPFTFELEAQVIEVSLKSCEPTGSLKSNPQGKSHKLNPQNKDKMQLRAIIDVGVLDIAPQYLIPKNKKIKIIGASSDMIVVDISESNYKYQVGSVMKFHMKYMGALSLINSKYITKKVL